MSKTKKKEIIQDSIIKNCDYFYRDQEMFRTDIEDLKHHSEVNKGNKIKKAKNLK